MAQTRKEMMFGTPPVWMGKPRARRPVKWEFIAVKDGYAWDPTHTHIINTKKLKKPRLLT